MQVTKIIEGRVCPKCGNTKDQRNNGHNRSGTQRVQCKACKFYYTLNPKNRAYSEEKRKDALRIYYSGVSARGVAKILKMHKSNVLNWIKKNPSDVDKSPNEI